MNNISFGKALVYVNPNKYIKNAKDSEIAEAINIGVRLAGAQTGVKAKHPTAKTMSGKLLRETNPDSFDKRTHKLTESGIEGFNKIYGEQMGVTTESKMKELVKAVKKHATKNIEQNVGTLTYSFQYMA